MATRKTPLRPDVKGRYRPQIGWRDAAHSSQVRFNLGSVETVSGAEAQRRADEIRKLFDAQCEQRQITHWGGDELEVAQAIARGVPYVFKFSDLAKSMPEAAFKEALIMDSFRRYGAGEIQPSDSATLEAAVGCLRKFVVKELEEFKAKERATWGNLYDQAGMPEGLLNGELATLGDAIGEYIAEEIETNGTKLDDGVTITQGGRNRRFRIKQVDAKFGTTPLAKLDWSACQTVVRHWGNRPPECGARRSA